MSATVELQGLPDDASVGVFLPTGKGARSRLNFRPDEHVLTCSLTRGTSVALYLAVVTRPRRIVIRVRKFGWLPFHTDRVIGPRLPLTVPVVMVPDPYVTPHLADAGPAPRPADPRCHFKCRLQHNRRCTLPYGHRTVYHRSGPYAWVDNDVLVRLADQTR